MRLHQHVLVIFVLIIFVASASLVCPVSSGIAQKFTPRKTEQILCSNVDEALCRFSTTTRPKFKKSQGEVVPPDSEGSIPNFQPEYEKTINLSIPLWLMEIHLSIDPVDYGISTEVYLRYPNMRIAKASGSLKDGGTLTVGLSNLLGSTLTLKVEEEDVILYYDFHAFNNGDNGRVVVLHLPDVSKSES
ncbi:hypothetical protein SCLCIDRAFT_1216319 [Scleroderma citrinum Foug A]|uniref:Uncharacterized protein n=1 Tax=Scleroderma citrinum Foug A TaxID=1036808 RepID=A0A0C3A831_9AGAM|nr:hypothetical protein SCLCIDRAFT_1216319 [Scleroderma citrinum Foug A]